MVATNRRRCYQRRAKCTDAKIRDKSVKLDVDIRNAAFSFDDMTTSIVAVITDVIRDGKPVAGFAFNSTGRYACGAQMRNLSLLFIPSGAENLPIRSARG